MSSPIIAEEPFMVCIIRKISLISSSPKLFSFSVFINIWSSCSRSEVVSNMYISTIDSMPASNRAIVFTVLSVGHICLGEVPFAQRFIYVISV